MMGTSNGEETRTTSSTAYSIPSLYPKSFTSSTFLINFKESSHFQTTEMPSINYDIYVTLNIFNLPTTYTDYFVRVAYRAIRSLYRANLFSLNRLYLKWLPIDFTLGSRTIVRRPSNKHEKCPQEHW